MIDGLLRKYFSNRNKNKWERSRAMGILGKKNECEASTNKKEAE